MKASDQLRNLRKKRAEMVTAVDTLLTTAEAEERNLSAEEDEKWEAAKKEISDLDQRITRSEALVDLIASNANAVVEDDNNDMATMSVERLFTGGASKSGSGPLIKTKRPKVKGGFFARQASYLYLAKGVPEIGAYYADRDGDKEMGAILRATVAAADTTTSGWAAELIVEEIGEFIDMLRPMAMFSRLPAGTDVSFAPGAASFKLPKLTGDVPGGYIAEGGAIKVAQGVFGTITIGPSKMGVIVPATRELLTRSQPNWETIMRNSMLESTAVVMDRRFLSNQAAGSGAPSGLFHTDNAVAAITASNLSNAADDANADLTAIEAAMNAASVPFGQRVWLMHSTKRLALASLRNAVGVFIYRDELATGMLNGYPVLDSPVFDYGINNGGATNIRTVAMINAGLLVRGYGILPTVDMSSEATLHMSDAPSADLGGSGDPTPVRSLWQTDSIALRLLWENSWKTKHTTSVQWIAGVNW